MNRGGRPTLTGQKLTRCTVYLTPDQVMAAYAVGAGNLSDGLRKQLAELYAWRIWQAERATRLDHPDPMPRKRHQ